MSDVHARGGRFRGRGRCVEQYIFTAFATHVGKTRQRISRIPIRMKSNDPSSTISCHPAFSAGLFERPSGERSSLGTARSGRLTRRKAPNVHGSGATDPRVRAIASALCPAAPSNSISRAFTPTGRSPLPRSGFPYRPPAGRVEAGEVVDRRVQRGCAVVDRQRRDPGLARCGSGDQHLGETIGPRGVRQCGATAGQRQLHHAGALGVRHHGQRSTRRDDGLQHHLVEHRPGVRVQRHLDLARRWLRLLGDCGCGIGRVRTSPHRSRRRPRPVEG